MSTSARAVVGAKGFGLAAAIALVLALVPASALAAGPEAAELRVEPPVHATAAFVRGVLNPKAAGEAGTYQFLYKASATECASGASAPEFPGLSVGAEHEEVSEFISGLQPGTEYTICLAATNEQAETSVSAPVTFTTPLEPEAETTPATNMLGRNATLNGVLDANRAGEPGSYQFIYNASGTQCTAEEGLQLQTPIEPSQGHHDEAVSADVANLLPMTQYAFCLRAFNAAGDEVTAAPVIFMTPGATPLVSGEAAVKVGETEATVAAQVDIGGEPGSYEVEYGSGQRTAPQPLPASTVPVAVRQTLTGLSPGASYGFHFVARNALGSAVGLGASFTAAVPLAPVSAGACPNTTLTGYTPDLPDCRAYEIVSPANEIGEVYVPGGTGGNSQEGLVEPSFTTTARLFRAAADGSAVAYVGDPGPVGGDGSSAKGRGNEFLAARTGAASVDGWASSDITPVVDERESPTSEREYAYFSSDLSVALFRTTQGPLLGGNPSPPSPPGCPGLYAREGGVEANEFHSLFSETLTPNECGKAPTTHIGRDHTLLFAGESSDHSEKLFQTPAALIPQATPTAGAIGGDLYASEDAHLTLVNVLPDGAIAPSATFGGPSYYYDNGPDLSNVIAANGSRIVWSAVTPGVGIDEETIPTPTALYVREGATTATPRTVQLDAAESGASGASGAGRFWGASSDDSKVFFTDCHRLTPDSTAAEGEGCQRVGRSISEGQEEVATGNDLYEYDFGRPPGDRLVDLTVDHDASGPLGADVQGVLAVSEDGAIVYFVAGGVLTDTPNARGERATTRVCERSTNGSELEVEEEGHLLAGKGCNLYEEQRGADGEWESPRFIAALAAQDDFLNEDKLNDPFTGGGAVAGDWIGDLSARTAEATPDGRSLVFESTQSLTGYESGALFARPNSGSEASLEIFSYSVGSNTLSCASCDPYGLIPSGKVVSNPYLPVSSSGTFMKRWISSDGSEVFFDSGQALLPQDTDQLQDVYEWEAQGGPSCPRATSVYGGCIFLLSGGQSDDASFLVDADESGNNVFFASRGSLAGVARADDKMHLFDARVDGGFPATQSGCAGASCAAEPQVTPAFSSPASANEAGGGNWPAPVPVSTPAKKAAAKRPSRAQQLAAALKSCRRTYKSHRKRVSCERVARRRYSAAKRAGARGTSKKRGVR